MGSSHARASELKPEPYYCSITKSKTLKNTLDLQHLMALPYTRSSSCVSMQGVLATNQNIYMLLNSAVI